MAISRRTFVQGSAAGAGALFVPYHALGAGQEYTPSFRPRFAQIGVGGNGVRTAPSKQLFADLVAICDVDSSHREQGNEILCGGKADLYADYREVLARDDIDIVAISTPDHWHTKIVVEAMLAGKDAYCEKPLTLTIDEGKLIRRVQRETGRKVQVGTQQRSMEKLFVKAIAMLAEGRLGKLRRVQTAIGSGAWSPQLPVADAPAALDWDRWLGPAPQVDYRSLPREGHRPFSNGHIDFRWWYEYSGGKLTDWGAHHIDIAMLGIAAAGHSADPVAVSGEAEHAVEYVDGKPADTTRYNTAQKFNLKVDFAGGDVELIIRNDTDNGILFEGERGRMFVNRGKLVGKPVEELASNPLPEGAISQVYRGMPMIENPEPKAVHFSNLLYCIENDASPIANVHSHMKMLNVCHLAGICCRLGRRIEWDPVRETIVGDDLAASMMKRPYRDGYEIDLG
ncbi:Inositol 2-dehydrogenase [Planctomycetes bacterium MalM25]|nr:Inositol 2-dehydrogenase [Planctomycetes bacterium MalM25]